MDREIDSVWKLAEPLADSMGYELLKVESSGGHGDKVLRLYLDKDGGVGIDDCERFSQALGPVLDVEADLQGSYSLEISSPGLDRPLNKLRHYAAQVGKIVQVTTEEPIEGRRHFKGELVAASGDGESAEIEVKVDGVSHRLRLSQIKKGQLDYFATEARQQAASGKGPKAAKKKI